MSEETVPHTRPREVFVRLLNEGTSVFRPTSAVDCGDGRFRLLTPDDYDPVDEQWEFPPRLGSRMPARSPLRSRSTRCPCPRHPIGIDHEMSYPLFEGTRVQVIDSHTGGEPTRVVVSGGPDLAGGTWRRGGRSSATTSTTSDRPSATSPRGSDTMVGALLCEPTDSACAAGVIFFNNVGVLTCAATARSACWSRWPTLGRVDSGTHKIETPVGVVEATLHGPNEVTVRNVPATGRPRGCRSRSKGTSCSRPEGTSPGAATGSSSSRTTLTRSPCPTSNA